jgi:hypothetical protein
MAEVKTDCFAYRYNGKAYCAGLERLYCSTEECVFYKKKGTLCESCNKARAHDCVACKNGRGKGMV